MRQSKLKELKEKKLKRLKEKETAFNEEKIKLENELRDLRDINRALEEELSSIRARLETFKKGGF